MAHSHDNPKFKYTCAKCGAPATKKPVKHHYDWKSLEANEFDGLGTWHCRGNCRGKIKVKRAKIQKQEKREIAA